MLDQGTFALNSRKVNRADLFAVKPLPLFAVEVQEKPPELFRAFEIYEGIAHVTLVLWRSDESGGTYPEIYREIKEVVIVLKVSVNPLEHEVLGILIGDITNHQSCLGGLMDLVRQASLARITVATSISYSLD